MGKYQIAKHFVFRSEEIVNCITRRFISPPLYKIDIITNILEINILIRFWEIYVEHHHGTY